MFGVSVCVFDTNPPCQQHAGQVSNDMQNMLETCFFFSKGSEVTLGLFSRLEAYVSYLKMPTKTI